MREVGGCGAVKARHVILGLSVVTLALNFESVRVLSKFTDSAFKEAIDWL